MSRMNLIAEKAATALLALRRLLSVWAALPATGLVVSALGLLIATPARSEPYWLVSQDKISVRVVEWRSGEGDYKDWKALGGAFVIDESGTVSIPLVGQVEAAGLTTKDLAAKIADALQLRAGLPSKPFVSVEVSQYGPIYIVGGVANAGQYPYSPDLTVMKAISLAGGFYRDPEAERSRLQRERIQAASALGDAELDYNGLLVRQARLKAEMEGKDGFEIPGILESASGVQELHAEELRLMKLRKVEFESKVASSRDLGNLYAHEIETLENKIVAQQRQLSLFKEELSKVKSLVNKGLSVSARRFELDRTEADAENKLLDLEFQLVRARQSLEENKRDSADLVNTMNSQIQNELNTIVREIAKSDLQMRVAHLLIDETNQEGQRLSFEERRDDERSIRLRIVRRSASGKTETIDADPHMLIQPRDLIEVDVIASGAATGDKQHRGIDTSSR